MASLLWCARSVSRWWISYQRPSCVTRDSSRAKHGTKPASTHTHSKESCLLNQRQHRMTNRSPSCVLLCQTSVHTASRGQGNAKDLQLLGSKRRVQRCIEAKITSKGNERTQAFQHRLQHPSIVQLGACQRRKKTTLLESHGYERTLQGYHLALSPMAVGAGILQREKARH
jgi:hypothetical protein